MMEIIRLTLKNMKANIKNNVIIFISITLSSMLLFLAALAFSTYRENKLKNIVDYYGDQYGIYSNVYLTQKSILDNDYNISKYYYAFKIEEINIDNNKINIYGISDNFQYNIDGAFPKNENEILISNDFQKIYHLRIGDYYDINNIKRKIVGTYNDKSKLTQSGLTDGINEIIFTKSKENNQKATFWVYLDSYDDVYNNLKSLQYDLNIKYDNPISEQIMDEVNLNMNTNYLGLFTVSYGEGAYTQAILKLILMLVMSILAFITLFVIYNSFAISVNERKSKYAMYKSIGASNKQILFSVMFEALILAIIAIPTGFLLSIFLVKIIIIIINNILTEIITNQLVFKVYLNYIIYAICYIFASIFLASLTPAKRASETNIIEVLRQNTEIGKTKSLFRKNKLVEKIFGIEGVLSRKNTIRNHRKYNVTTFSIIVGCILFLTFSIFINVFFFEYKNAYNVYNKEVSVTVYDSDKKEEFINKIINLDHVDNYLYFSKDCMFKFEYNSDDLTDEYKSRLGGNYGCFLYLDMNNYQNITNKENNVMVGTYIVPTYTTEGINIKNYTFKFFNKDKIVFKALKKDSFDNFEYYKTFENINIINDYSNIPKEFDFEYNITPTLILPYENTDNSVTIELTGKDYKKLDIEILNIINEYPEYSFDYTNSYMDNYNIFQIVKAVQIIIYLVIFIIFTITIVSIYSTVNTNLSLRRREFSVLKSIGLNNKGINKMVLYESLMLSIKGLIFGILLSILLIILFVKIFMLSSSAIYLIFFQMPATIYLKPIIICTAMIFLINYLTFYIVTNKFKKDNIADILKENSY